MPRMDDEKPKSVDFIGYSSLNDRTHICVLVSLEGGRKRSDLYHFPDCPIGIALLRSTFYPVYSSVGLEEHLTKVHS